MTSARTKSHRKTKKNWGSNFLAFLLTRIFENKGFKAFRNELMKGMQNYLQKRFIK